MESVTGQAQHETNFGTDCGHDPGIYPIRLGGGVVICNRCFKSGARDIAHEEYKDFSVTCPK